MITYLALGDSYTCGEAVEPEQNFPNRLVARLRTDGLDVADPKIIATTGWTTDELEAGITQANVRGNTYDLVTLLIGVNNQYRGPSKGFTLDGYKQEFIELLDEAITFAGGNRQHVIVVSIPDWGAMPFGEGQDRAAITTDIDAYNAANRQVARDAGVKYADVTSISRLARADLELAASDGLHPSGKMYAEWVEVIAPLAKMDS